MKICAIAAVSKNNVIGKDDELPWDLPKDLEHFRSTTMGYPIIMGRKTFDSFPNPLPNRQHIVLTRNNSLSSSNEKVTYVNSVDDALNKSQQYTEEIVFIIGGQSIYELFFDEIDSMILTHVYNEYKGDTFFPEFDKHNWDTKTVKETNKFKIIKYIRKNL